MSFFKKGPGIVPLQSRNKVKFEKKGWLCAFWNWAKVKRMASSKDYPPESDGCKQKDVCFFFCLFAWLKFSLNSFYPFFFFFLLCWIRQMLSHNNHTRKTKATAADCVTIGWATIICQGVSFGLQATKKFLQIVGVNFKKVFLHCLLASSFLRACSFPSRPLGCAKGGTALHLKQQLAGAAHVADWLDQSQRGRRSGREVKVFNAVCVALCLVRANCWTRLKSRVIARDPREGL